MKSIKSILPRAAVLILIMTILCGVIYPLVITGISKLFFREKANGSIIEVDGVKYGSELLGQKFTGDEYLWGRIMLVNTDAFTDETGKKALYGTVANLSPASEEYQKLIQERVKMIQKSNPDATRNSIPVDLVTSSGSGLDPHISVAAAKYQVPRIAKSRNMSEEEVQKIIDNHTTGRFLGIFGEKVVNVLEVNLDLLR